MSPQSQTQAASSTQRFQQPPQQVRSSKTIAQVPCRIQQTAMGREFSFLAPLCSLFLLHLLPPPASSDQFISEPPRLLEPRTLILRREGSRGWRARRPQTSSTRSPPSCRCPGWYWHSSSLARSRAPATPRSQFSFNFISGTQTLDPPLVSDLIKTRVSRSRSRSRSMSRSIEYLLVLPTSRR